MIKRLHIPGVDMLEKLAPTLPRRPCPPSSNAATPLLSHGAGVPRMIESASFRGRHPAILEARAICSIIDCQDVVAFTRLGSTRRTAHASQCHRAVGALQRQADRSHNPRIWGRTPAPGRRIRSFRARM